MDGIIRIAQKSDLENSQIENAKIGNLEWKLN